jgi:hypothetical protein
MDEVLALSLDVNEYLRGYVRIHDYVFRQSIRYIIPLPLIFKAIHFDKALSALEVVSEGLKTCEHRALQMVSSSAGEQREYLELLFEYVQSLIVTLNLLKAVLRGLHSKNQSWRQYGWRAYKSDVAKYHLSTKTYIAVGGRLNKKFRALTERAPYFV